MIEFLVGVVAGAVLVVAAAVVTVIVIEADEKAKYRGMM